MIRKFDEMIQEVEDKRTDLNATSNEEINILRANVGFLKEIKESCDNKIIRTKMYRVMSKR